MRNGLTPKEMCEFICEVFSLSKTPEELWNLSLAGEVWHVYNPLMVIIHLREVNHEKD